MAYIEHLSNDGKITRKYFGLDSSGIFRMYYNGKIVKFPTKTLLMGKGNKVGISIDMRRFVKNFILLKAYVKIKISNPNPRGELFVYKSKNISSNIKEEVGKMKKDKRGYFIFDVTDLLKKQINTRLNLIITTISRVDLYTLFAFYDSNAEFVVEYYDDSYISDNVLKMKDKGNIINVDFLNGINILERSLMKIGLLDLKLIINSHHNSKFMFNYEQYIYGGINNYKYIDSKGIKHYFKLSGTDQYKTHSDIYDEALLLESGPEYLLKMKNEYLIFNDKGRLIEVKSNKGNIMFFYNESNISLIKDSLGNYVQFDYFDNKVIITDSNSKTMIIYIYENYIRVNKLKYYFNKNIIVISVLNCK